MEEQRPVQGQVQIKADEKELQGEYSNLVMIHHNLEEFTLNFIYIFPNGQQGKLLKSMIVSPGHAKRIFRALGENIEDDLFAIDDRQARKFFPIALLARGQLVVEDDDAGVRRLGERDNFGGFTGAGEIRGMQGGNFHEHRAHNRQAERPDQFAQLLQQAAAFPHGLAADMHAHQERLHAGGVWSVD